LAAGLIRDGQEFIRGTEEARAKRFSAGTNLQSLRSGMGSIGAMNQEAKIATAKPMSKSR
jgi:hypothetical protein